MNRREVLSCMTSMCAASGIEARCDVVESEPRPILAVIHCDERITPEVAETVRKHWECVRKLTPELPPCVVMCKGLTLELKVHPDDGEVIENR